MVFNMIINKKLIATICLLLLFGAFAFTAFAAVTETFYGGQGDGQIQNYGSAFADEGNLEIKNEVKVKGSLLIK